MPDPGTDVLIIGDAHSGGDPTATDALFLLSTAGTATPVQHFAADTGDTTLDGYISAYFQDGGQAVWVQGIGTGTPLPTPVNAVGLLPPGPGQIVAPSIVDAATIAAIADAGWAQNKVTIANGASNATDGTLTTLAAAIITASTGGGKGAGLWADTLTYSTISPPATYQVPSSITVAALIAASDITTGRPGAAAAGANGITIASAIAAERTDAARSALKTGQVNTFKTVNRTIRNYGIRALANLTTAPAWWNFWAARVIMAAKAKFALTAEDFVFDEIDHDLISSFGGRLMADCQSMGSALPFYSVDVGPTINTRVTIQAGQLKARVRLSVASNAEHIEIDVIRQS